MWKYTSHCINHVKTAVPSILQNTRENFVQQTRNTFILRRKFKEPLLNKGERYRKLSPRQFVYELVEDQNIKKSAPIDIILIKDVLGVGQVGDKVTMHSNIAYTHLLLPKLAIYASPENIQKYFVEKQIQSVVYSSPHVKETIDFLTTANLAVEMNPTEPWVLQKWHIRVTFRKLKYVVPEEAITLPPKPITGPGENMDGKQFFIIVTINNKEHVKVRCTLKYWRDVRLRFNDAFFCEKGTAIFPEDQPILDAMPVMDNREERRKFFK